MYAVFLTSYYVPVTVVRHGVVEPTVVRITSVLLRLTSFRTARVLRLRRCSHSDRVVWPRLTPVAVLARPAPLHIRSPLRLDEPTRASRLCIRTTWLHLLAIPTFSSAGCVYPVFYSRFTDAFLFLSRPSAGPTTLVNRCVMRLNVRALSYTVLRTLLLLITLRPVAISSSRSGQSRLSVAEHRVWIAYGSEQKFARLPRGSV